MRRLLGLSNGLSPVVQVNTTRRQGFESSPYLFGSAAVVAVEVAEVGVGLFGRVEVAGGAPAVVILPGGVTLGHQLAVAHWDLKGAIVRL